MTVSGAIDASAYERAGIEALERGDPAAARTAFLAAAEASASPGESLWWGLARSCDALDDDDQALAAVDRLLAISPRHVLGLIMKADHKAKQGDGRAAYAFYAAAVGAAGDLQRLPRPVRGEIGRAQRQMAHFADAYAEHLLSVLAEAGFDPARSSSRFGQAIDLLLGRKSLFVQTPTAFYFPELPQRQFYEREEFPWLANLEARTPAIRDELEAVVRAGAGIRPYLEVEANRPALEFGDLAGSLDWSAFDIIKFGAPVPEASAACPETLAAVEKAPLCRSPGRTPSVLFSLLRPGAHILPHVGYTNARLICHLPLIVPEHCGLRVGNETRTWTPGEALVFDDSIEHEAWNRSSSLRAVLIFDIWRPELTEAERSLVSALLAAVATFGVTGA